MDAKLEVAVISLGGVVAMVLPEEPLVKAVMNNEVAEVKQLAFSSNVNVRDKGIRMTALEQAVENGNLEIVRTLLFAGANAKSRNDAR